MADLCPEEDSNHSPKNDQSKTTADCTGKILFTAHALYTVDYNLMYYFCIILLSDPSHKIIITNLRQTLNCEEQEIGRFTDLSSIIPYRPIPSFHSNAVAC